MSLGQRGVAVGAALLIAATLTVQATAAERETPWSFGGIGVSQTTIRILALGGGCQRPLDPLVEETSATVRITARTFDPEGLTTPCTADIRFEMRYVRLQAPLAGRVLVGASPKSVPYPEGTPAPRVVGLAPRDAAAVLRDRRLSPVIVRHRGGPGRRRVTGQRGERLVVSGTDRP